MKIKDERGCIIDVSEEEAIQRLRKRDAEDIAKELFNNNTILIIDEKKYKELYLKISDLEAKLEEGEKLNKRLQQVIDKLRDKEFAGETLVNAVNAVYEPLYQNKYDEVEQLKQQLADKDQAIEGLQEINQSLGQICNNDAKEIERLREQIAEKEGYIKRHIPRLIEANKKFSKQLRETEKERHEEWLTGKEWKRECDRLKREQNQTAIETLEKVKENIKLKDKDGFVVHNRTTILHFIDQQIKSLKGEK